MAYASPFIFYYSSDHFERAVFSVILYSIPKSGWRPAKYWPLGNWGVVPLLLELIALISLFWIAVKRRDWTAMKPNSNGLFSVAGYNFRQWHKTRAFHHPCPSALSFAFCSRIRR